MLEDELRQGIARRVRARREQMRLSRRELGDLIGRSEATVGNIENGIYLPHTPLCIALARHLRMSFEYLFLGAPADRLDWDLQLAVLPSSLAKWMRTSEAPFKDVWALYWTGRALKDVLNPVMSLENIDWDRLYKALSPWLTSRRKRKEEVCTPTATVATPTAATTEPEPGS